MALNNETIEEVELFFLQYGRLLDYSYDDILRNHPFLDIITLKDFYSQNTSEVMQKVCISKWIFWQTLLLPNYFRDKTLNNAKHDLV